MMLRVVNVTDTDNTDADVDAHADDDVEDVGIDTCVDVDAGVYTDAAVDAGC